MTGNPLVYFTDAVLRAPTIGCMLMCLSASLVGVIAFLRKQALIGEALSHAAYPGVIMGVMTLGAFSTFGFGEAPTTFFIMAGAFATALAGIWTISFLERKIRVRSDSALCFVLSVFFGIGITMASQVQFSHSTLYIQSLSYLYGQAATMTDVHIAIYGVLSLFILLLVAFLYKELQVITFDREYAKSLGIRVGVIDKAFFVLIVLAIVVGIRSVGVVLMSAMLIAPAAAARQFTHKLYMMFILAGLFGMVSGFLGNYLSIEGTYYLSFMYPHERLSLPTGPMIVLAASSISVLSLLFAPERGLVVRSLRAFLFRSRCVKENILKTIWRIQQENEPVSLQQVKRFQPFSTLYLWWVLTRLKKSGWLKRDGRGKGYRLTRDGQVKAGQIVRLHRLWEVYLADYLEIGAEKVHRSAEEMEHIITPELEKELTKLLHDPKIDPHQQPIPPSE